MLCRWVFCCIKPGIQWASVLYSRLMDFWCSKINYSLEWLTNERAKVRLFVTHRYNQGTWHLKLTILPIRKGRLVEPIFSYQCWMVNVLHIEVASLLLLGSFKLEANSPVLPNTVDNFTNMYLFTIERSMIESNMFF